MPFTFAPNVIVTSEQFSQMQFGVPDGAATLTAEDKANTEFLVNAANETILSFISRSVLQATVVEVFDGQESDLILLREFPVRELLSVKFAGNGQFAAAQNVLTNSPFAVTASEDGELTMRDGLFPRGRAMIEVTYKAGWAAADVPYDLRMALLLQYDWLRKLKNPGKDGGGKMLGVSSRSKMGESESKDTTVGEFGMPKEVSGMLARYRRMEAPSSIMFARTT